MKYALITGGTKGIGKAIGERLLQDGYAVILNYSNDDVNANKVHHELLNLYTDKVFLLKENLSNTENINAFCSKVLTITSTLDLIIFNAGKTDRSEFSAITLENWQSVFNSNLTIPFFILQRLSLNMPKHGVVIFTGSLMGVYPHSMSVSYGVSKAGVHALVKNLVKHLAPKNIRVNAIVPGFVDTEWQNEKPVKIRENIEKKISLSRFSKTEEVADACAFLINNKYMNGELLVIDGGYCFE